MYISWPVRMISEDVPVILFLFRDAYKSQAVSRLRPSPKATELTSIDPSKTVIGLHICKIFCSSERSGKQRFAHHSRSAYLSSCCFRGVSSA